MTIFTLGTQLEWTDIVPLRDRIKKLGIVQCMAIYHRYKQTEYESFVWGDELEYTIVNFDHKARRVRVSLRAGELIAHLRGQQQQRSGLPSNWANECTTWMLESQPTAPYHGIADCFIDAERSIRQRRLQLESLLGPDESALLFGFPAIGTPDFTLPPFKFNESDSSIFLSNSLIYQGAPVFQNNMTLIRNSIARCESNINAIHMPIYRDTNTPIPFIENLSNPKVQLHCKPDNVFMDDSSFGWGLCALQATIQGRNDLEARWIHDQLVPLCPLIIALSAASPIIRGFLIDLDSRLVVIDQCADDRTPEERGERPLKDGQFLMDKGRCYPVECYMHPDSTEFDDVHADHVEELFQQLCQGGIDKQFAHYIARLLVRDPILVFKEKLEEETDGARGTAHFDAFQFTVFPYLRFKVPLEDGSAGWRVEFRPTDVQLTEFENAAFCCFILLTLRALSTFGLSLVAPLTLIQQNVQRSYERNAVLRQKFHFRVNLQTAKSTSEFVQNSFSHSDAGKTEEMSLDAIINGNNDGFIGLVPLIRFYLDRLDTNLIGAKARKRVDEYLAFIQGRASGHIKTPAKWIRDFVANHPDYAHDSRVPPEVIYELVKTMDKIVKGQADCPELLGTFATLSENE